MLPFKNRQTDDETAPTAVFRSAAAAKRRSAKLTGGGKNFNGFSPAVKHQRFLLPPSSEGGISGGAEPTLRDTMASFLLDKLELV